MPEVTHLMVGSDISGFARRVKDARNLRTHLNPSPKDEPDLVLLGAQLAVILEAAILYRELGFESATIAERMSRGSRLRRLAVAASRQRPQMPE